MQIIAILTFTFILFIFMAISTEVIFIDAKTNDDLSYLVPDQNLSNWVKSAGSDNNSIQNNASLITDDSEVKGLLVVKIKVNNKDIGNKTSSDFIITMHANDPMPVSFLGNPHGTNVKLGMGMYSVSQSTFPNYITTYSSDCFGGIMAVVAKICIITNNYDNSSLPIKN